MTSASSFLNRVRRGWARAVSQMWSWLRARAVAIVLVLSLIVAVVVVAVTAETNPTIATTAGVIVGAVVTAAATWWIGPTVERQVRWQAEREIVLAEMVNSLWHSREDVSLETDLFQRNEEVLRDLKTLEALADRSLLLAMRTRDRELVRICTAWRSACFDAILAVNDLSDEDDEVEAETRADGKVALTLLLGGALGDVRDLPPLHKEAYLLCERVGEEKRALLARAIELSNMPDPRATRDPRDATISERRFMNAILTSVFHSWGSEPATASALGAHLVSQEAVDEDLHNEIQDIRSQWLTDIPEENETEAIGEVAFVVAAPGNDEPLGAYPVLRGEVLGWIREQGRERPQFASNEAPDEASR